MAGSAGPVALTGATGFLGAHLADAFRARGMAFRAVIRNPARGTFEDVAKADLADPPSLARAFAGCAAVVANAALGGHDGSLEDFHRANVGGTENVLRAAAQAGVPRVVLVSTVAVYHTRLYQPMREDHPGYGESRRLFAWTHLTTSWKYAVTKTIAERRAWELARELGLCLTVLRPGPIYGSRDTRWTARLVRALSRRVAWAPTVGVPLVHAGDVAAAGLAALETPASEGRAFTLAGEPRPVWAVLRAFRDVLGSRTILVPVPLPVWVRYDTSAAREVLGFRERPLLDGLREVVEGGPLPAVR